RGARALPRLLHGRQPGHDDEPAVTTLEGVDLDLWPSSDGPAHGEGSVEQPLHEGEGGERRLRATIRPEQTQVTIVDVADDLPGWRKILELVPGDELDRGARQEQRDDPHQGDGLKRGGVLVV